MSTIRVPLLGTIATGTPIAVPDSDFALDPGNFIEISEDLLPAGTDPKNLFALQVQGNGMVDAGLDDCDIVVLKAAQTAKDGDIVAVWFPEHSETLLARLYHEGDGYRLESANAGMHPVHVRVRQQVEIKGKVVAMIRTIRD